MTDGKFALQPFSAGESCPACGCWMVASGTVEYDQTYTGYYIGRIDVHLRWLGAVQLHPRMHNAWMMFGDGQKLMNEVYDNFNVVAAVRPAGGQMFGWFRRAETRAISSA